MEFTISTLIKINCWLSVNNIIVEIVCLPPMPSEPPNWSKVVRIAVAWARLFVSSRSLRRAMIWAVNILLTWGASSARINPDFAYKTSPKSSFQISALYKLNSRLKKSWITICDWYITNFGILTSSKVKTCWLHSILHNNDKVYYNSNAWDSKLIEGKFL